LRMRTRQRRVLALGILVLAVVAAESVASLTDSEPHAPPDFYGYTPPAVGQSYVDPVFGERVIRGTDALNMENPGPFDYMSPEYSSSAITNADDSYVRITDSRGAQNLFSLPEFNYFRRLRLVSSSQSDFWWHVTDPNLLYAVPRNRLVQYDVATDQTTTVHTFSEFGNVSGMGESNLSHDGNRLALRGRNPVSGDPQLFVYEFSSDSVIASLDIPTIPGFFDGTIAPSGDRVIIHTFPERGRGGIIEVWDINEGAGTLTQGYVLPRGGGHNDSSYGPDGKEYMIIIDSWVSNTLYRYDLDDGTRTTLMHFGWDGSQSPIALHVSTNSMHNDGWIYLSTYIGNRSDPDPSQHWIPFQGELLRIRWDGSAIERLAHNRTQAVRYWNQPRATVSTSGRYLFWASNYRRNHVPSAPDSYADTYFMDLHRLTTAPPARAHSPSSWTQLRIDGSNGAGITSREPRLRTR